MKTSDIMSAQQLHEVKTHFSWETEVELTYSDFTYKAHFHEDVTGEYIVLKQTDGFVQDICTGYEIEALKLKLLKKKPFLSLSFWWVQLTQDTKTKRICFKIQNS